MSESIHLVLEVKNDFIVKKIYKVHEPIEIWYQPRWQRVSYIKLMLIMSRFQKYDRKVVVAASGCHVTLKSTHPA